MAYPSSSLVRMLSDRLVGFAYLFTLLKIPRVFRGSVFSTKITVRSSSPTLPCSSPRCSGDWITSRSAYQRCWPSRITRSPFPRMMNPMASPSWR